MKKPNDFIFYDKHSFLSSVTVKFCKKRKSKCHLIRPTDGQINPFRNFADQTES